jgi:hypothetical protein
MVFSTGDKRLPISLTKEAGKRDSRFFERRPDSGASFVRWPRSPLCLEASLVLLIYSAKNAGFKLAERAVSEMVNEAIFRGDHAIAGLSDAKGKVVILEHSDPERLIQFTHLAPDFARHKAAEQRRNFNRSGLTAFFSRAVKRKILHCGKRLVVGIDLGLGIGKIRHRRDEAY